MYGSNNAASTTETFEGRGGNDFIDGGGGFDRASYAFDESGITVSLATGVVTGGPTTGTDTLRSIEGIVGTEFNDVYDATGFGGGSLNAGSSGTLNEFFGQGGNDTVIGNGNTRVSFSSSSDDVTVTLQEGATHGSATGAVIGTDDIVSGVNAVRGSNYNDTINGNSSANALDGGAGNDLINGKTGSDMLTGGAGNDTFVFGQNDGTDTITDFTIGQDVIQLNGIFDSAGDPNFAAFLNSIQHMADGDHSMQVHSGTNITLTAVNVNQFHASDFIIHA
jgi:Ca2+-binding RTX toxin-like protein